MLRRLWGRVRPRARSPRREFPRVVRRHRDDFGELERGFAAIANALLDFEVEGDRLVLELDVLPFVTFDNITLLSWHLTDPVDRELAAQKSVRLRRLLQFDRPSARETRPAKRHDEGAIRLLGVDVAPIAIELAATPSGFVLSVANVGPTLPANMRSELFDSLVSIREQSDDGRPHLGLGLHIVALIAKFHGGRAQADDLADGSGAVFRVWFPRAGAEPAR